METQSLIKTFEVYCKKFSMIINAYSIEAAINAFKKANKDEIVILAEDVNYRELNNKPLDHLTSVSPKGPEEKTETSPLPWKYLKGRSELGDTGDYVEYLAITDNDGVWLAEFCTESHQVDEEISEANMMLAVKCVNDFPKLQSAYDALLEENTRLKEQIEQANNHIKSL